MLRKPMDEDEPLAPKWILLLSRRKRSRKKGATKPRRTASERFRAVLDAELRKRTYSDPQHFT